MTRDLLLWVHIAAVAAWLGANFVQLALASRFDRESAEAAAAWTRQTIWMGERYYAPVGAVVGITGIALVVTQDWSWSSGFIWVGIVVVVIGAALGVLAFSPLAKKRLAAIESGDTVTAAAVQRRIIPLAFLDTGLILLAVLAMVAKWMT